MMAEGVTTDSAANRSSTEATEPVKIEKDPEWETFETDYPEVAGPMKKFLEPLTNKVSTLEADNKRLATALQTVGEDRLESAAEAEEAKVKEVHPDYEDIANSDDFIAWAQTQPDMIYAGITANAKQIVDSSSVSKILDLYKTDKGIAKGDGKDGSSAGRKKASKRNAADPIRDLQLRSNTGAPSPTPGVALPDETRDDAETYDSEWDKIERDEKERIKSAA